MYKKPNLTKFTKLCKWIHHWKTPASRWRQCDITSLRHPAPSFAKKRDSQSWMTRRRELHKLVSVFIVSDYTDFICHSGMCFSCLFRTLCHNLILVRAHTAYISSKGDKIPAVRATSTSETWSSHKITCNVNVHRKLTVFGERANWQRTHAF